MKQERQAEALVLPSERREKKCERDVFIPYEYNIKIINRNIKILNGSATVTMHICTVTVVIVHKCTILHKLLWVFFSSNCVKSAIFSILHNYAQTDVIALRWTLIIGTKETHCHEQKLLEDVNLREREREREREFINI